MQFRHAFFYMLEGKAVKLPHWSGYWVWENGTIMMYTKEGEVLDIRKTERPAYTFSNIADVNWEVCERPSIPVKKTEQKEPVAEIKTAINEAAPKIDEVINIDIEHKITLYLKNYNVAISVAVVADDLHGPLFYLGIWDNGENREQAEREAELNLYKHIQQHRGMPYDSKQSDVRNVFPPLINRADVLSNPIWMEMLSEVIFSAMVTLRVLYSAVKTSELDVAHTPESSLRMNDLNTSNQGFTGR